MDRVLKENRYGTSAKNIGTMLLGEGALFVLILLLWIDRILLTYIRAVIMSLPIIGFMADYIITGVYILLIVFSIPEILRRMRRNDFIFLFVTLIVCLFNYIMFPENVEIMNEMLPGFIFFTFPLYFIGLSFDFERIYPWLYRLSLVTIVAFTLYKLFVSAPMTEIQSLYHGDMWGSYNILPHVCVVAIAMLKKPGFINVVLTMIGIIMVAFLGSRGPLICTVLSMATYLVFFKKYKRPFVAYTVIAISAVLVIVGLNPIMEQLYILSKEAGLSIRVFEKFFEGSISDSSSREYIAERLYERISDNPILGYGLYSDRVVLGTYAHQVAIELWHAFGILFGTAILGTIIIILARAAKIIKQKEEYALIFLPLLFAGFVKLFLSSSFLEEVNLFLLLGISVSLIRNNVKNN